MEQSTINRWAMNLCIPYGNSVLKSDAFLEMISDDNRTFESDPDSLLGNLTTLILTDPAIVAALHKRSDNAVASAILRFSEEFKQRNMQCWNNFVDQLANIINSDSDICENLIMASSIAGFYYTDKTSIAMARIYLNRVITEPNNIKFSPFIEEPKFLMLLYIALWECNCDDFREMALADYYGKKPQQSPPPRKPDAEPSSVRISNNNCCICGGSLREGHAVLLRTRLGQEARIDERCHNVIYALAKSENTSELKRAITYMKSRLGSVDREVAKKIQSYIDSAEDYISRG